MLMLFNHRWWPRQAGT